MASVVIAGDTSGTVTLQAPAVAGSTTLNLPASGGTVALTSQLGGLTLLGTISTASGASASLSSLTLTDYKQLLCVFQGVSHNDPSTINLLCGNSTSDDVVIYDSSSVPGQASWTAAEFLSGTLLVDLTNGTFVSYAYPIAPSSNTSGLAAGQAGDLPITKASTTISFATSLGSFDAESILVYGVK